MNNSISASLVVVGIGIKFISHITTEAKAHIQKSDRVLYLVNDPAMQNWIESIKPDAESLDFLYIKYSRRLLCYQAISEYILEVLRKKCHLCVVFYGHPCVFSMPGLDAVLLAKKEGYDARVLPGVSAEDCLFADLLINPGSSGCQSYNTTDFLIYRRSFSTASHLVLWQIGSIGSLGHEWQDRPAHGLQILSDYLKKFYTHNHLITIYEAAQYPGMKPLITIVPLSDLVYQRVSRISTLYVPPVINNVLDKAMLEILNMDKNDLVL